MVWLQLGIDDPLCDTQRKHNAKRPTDVEVAEWIRDNAANFIHDAGLDLEAYSE